MPDWLDGYSDATPEDLSSDDGIGSSSGLEILRCRHCGSPDLRPRNSRSDSAQVQFICTCGRFTTHHLEHGYAKCFRAKTQEETHGLPSLSTSDDDPA